MDSFEKFSESKLRDRCEFYSSLKDGYISEKDHLHAISVWNEFKMKSLGDYYDLYLKTDVFEKFINWSLKYYGLDPCHYFSSPGLSWNAMLKMTETELELISDIKMYLHIEEGMRGVISYIAKRYSKANKKYMTVVEKVNSLFI